MGMYILFGETREGAIWTGDPPERHVGFGLVSASRVKFSAYGVHPWATLLWGGEADEALCAVVRDHPLTDIEDEGGWLVLDAVRLQANVQPALISYHEAVWRMPSADHVKESYLAHDPFSAVVMAAVMLEAIDERLACQYPF